MTRSVIDFGSIVRRAQRREWALVILDPEINLASETGRLIGNIIVSVSAWRGKYCGQQLGSKRLKSASLNHAESNREQGEKPHE